MIAKLKSEAATIVMISALLLITLMVVQYGTREQMQNGLRRFDVTDYFTVEEMLRITLSGDGYISHLRRFLYDDTLLEIFFLHTPDGHGTTRLVFNVSTTCYASGSGYFVQDGLTLICQSCSGVFHIEDVHAVPFSIDFDDVDIDELDSQQAERFLRYLELYELCQPKPIFAWGGFPPVDAVVVAEAEFLGVLDYFGYMHYNEHLRAENGR